MYFFFAQSYAYRSICWSGLVSIKNTRSVLVQKPASCIDRNRTEVPLMKRGTFLNEVDENSDEECDQDSGGVSKDLWHTDTTDYTLHALRKVAANFSAATS